jgi:hypothetical protein
MPSSCSRRRTRRSRGGAAALNEAFADIKADVKAPAAPAAPAPAAAAPAAAQKGGRRKSRKLSKGAKAWTTAVTKLYREMKAKDKSVKFGDALKRASALKKKGQL